MGNQQQIDSCPIPMPVSWINYSFTIHYEIKPIVSEKSVNRKNKGQTRCGLYPVYFCQTLKLASKIAVFLRAHLVRKKCPEGSFFLL